MVESNSETKYWNQILLLAECVHPTAKKIKWGKKIIEMEG